MQAVLSATTAYELFFAHFLRVELIYRPNSRDAGGIEDEIEWLNTNAVLLLERTQRHTFDPMRKLFLRVALSERLTSRAAAAANIAAIVRHPDDVPRAEIDGLADGNLRALVLRVLDAAIAPLRNNIVHKSAYRPSSNETLAAVTDAYETVFALGRHFGLADDDYHLNERFPRVG